MCQRKIRVKRPDGSIFFADCGKCPSCQQKHANRVASMIDLNKVKDGKHINLFLTLTYSNDFIPYVFKDDVYKVLDSYGCGERTSFIPVYRDYSVRRVRVKKLDADFEHYVHKDWFRVSNAVTGVWYADKIKENDTFSRKVDYLEIFPDFYTSSLKDDIDGLHPFHVCVGVDERCRKIYEPNQEDKIGILLNSDIQNFWKRFDINLKRKYNYYGSYSRFSVGEYGSSSLRPHFHAILQIEKDAFAEVYQSIFDSWKFADYDRLSAGIEVEIHAASYVASYLNKFEDIPPIYYYRPFKPKYSHSSHYGLSNDVFSLPSILSKFQQKDMRYTRKFKQEDTLVERLVMLPSSSISYYFPKIKGFNKLTSSEIALIYSNPQRYLPQYAKRLGYDSRYIRKLFDGQTLSSCFVERLSEFSEGDNIFMNRQYVDVEFISHRKHDLRLNISRIQNARLRVPVHVLLGLPEDTKVTPELYLRASWLYGKIASQIWTTYASNVLKFSHENPEYGSLKDYYLNYCDIIRKPSLCKTFKGLYSPDDLEIYKTINSSAYDLSKDELLLKKRFKTRKKQQVSSNLNNLLYG